MLMTSPQQDQQQEGKKLGTGLVLMIWMILAAPSICLFVWVLSQQQPWQLGTNCGSCCYLQLLLSTAPRCSCPHSQLN